MEDSEPSGPIDDGNELEIDIRGFLPAGVALVEDADEPRAVERADSNSPNVTSGPEDAHDEAAKIDLSDDAGPEVEIDPDVEVDLRDRSHPDTETDPDVALDIGRPEPGDPGQTSLDPEPGDPGQTPLDREPEPEKSPVAEVAETTDAESTPDPSSEPGSELEPEPPTSIDTDVAEPAEGNLSDSTDASDTADTEVEVVTISGVVSIQDLRPDEPMPPAWALSDVDTDDAIADEDEDEDEPDADEDAPDAGIVDRYADETSPDAVADDPVTDDAGPNAVADAAGDDEAVIEEVAVADETLLERLEADFAEVEGALAAIDAGDLDRSPLLVALLAEV